MSLRKKNQTRNSIFSLLGLFHESGYVDPDSATGGEPEEGDSAGTGKIAWKLPDWSATLSNKPDSEMEPQGAFGLTLGYTQWTDTIPDPDETYNVYGVWLAGHPPLGGTFPTSAIGSFRWGDGNWGWGHQSTHPDTSTTYTGHTHVKYLAVHDNDQCVIKISHPYWLNENDVWEQDHNHYDNNGYSKFVRVWALDSGQDNSTSMQSAYDTWTSTEDTGNTTVDAVFTHWYNDETQTDGTRPEYYQVDESAFRDQIVAWYNSNTKIGFYVYENDY